MLWYVLQSIDVSASPKTVSACGASSTLSTTAYFKLFTKNEDKTTSYDFWKVTYHDIDFNNLHEVK